LEDDKEENGLNGIGDIKILVVDDEKGMRESLSEWLREDGYDVASLDCGEAAVACVEEKAFNLVLVDLKMPGIDGIETMKRIRQRWPDLPVIIITAYATVDTAVQAMKEGAFDYVVKPFNPEEISIMIAKVLQHQKLLQENTLLRQQLENRWSFQDIIGKSDKMQVVFDLVKSIAKSRSTVLIQGESGTGKELVAHAIHEISDRRDAPFVSLSCGSLSETLLESELFGHEKGAFTDAKFLKKGRIELAEGGTLFLDEVGEISPKSQINLLRVIQEREFLRVGGTEVNHMDVRVIAATNRNLEKAIAEGRFREDLFYRLNVINIKLPPLRERSEDIRLLASHFLKKYNLENRRQVRRFSERAMESLLRHTWQGNVRELENAVERAVVVCKGNLIQPADLPDNISGGVMTATETFETMSLSDVETRHISTVLSANEWNIAKSSQILGIDRTTLYRKIEKYGLSRED
jgi:DNA-binding NtrC family response regulator